MIYLEKGQKVKDRPDLVVYEQTGERNDVDMVVCAKSESPDEPFCWLEAQYIEYGGLVYTINDEKELEKEILKFDPNTTINDIVENPAPTQQLTVDTPAQIQQQEVSPVQNNTQNQEVAVPAENIPTEQPLTPSEPVAPVVPTDTASSTPPVDSTPVVPAEPLVEPSAGEPTASQVVEPVVEPVTESTPIPTPAETPSVEPTEPVAPTEQVVSINNRRRIRKIIV